MVKVDFEAGFGGNIPEELYASKRHLTENEIQILKDNHNFNEDPEWKNIYVDAEEGCFNPSLIAFSFFSGIVVLGKIVKTVIRYNDLNLGCGIRNSKINEIEIVLTK